MSAIKKLGLIIDENGKRQLAPLDRTYFEDTCTSLENAQPKYIPIGKLNLALLEDSPDPPTKKRKTCGTRKELFKSEEKLAKPLQRQTSFSRRTTTSINKNIPRAKTKLTFQPQTSRSMAPPPTTPIPDKKKNMSPIPPSFKVNKNGVKSELQYLSKHTPLHRIPEIGILSPGTAEVLRSEEEFLELEKALESNDQSPVSSVCSLLQKTTINNTTSILDQLKDVINEQTQQFHEMKIQFELYSQKYEKNVALMNDLVQKLESTDETQAKPRRKSLRLAGKSSPNSPKPLLSPVMTRSMDLRKSTLKKNLTNSITLPTPRRLKAEAMFNGFKADYNLVNTPKKTRPNFSPSRGDSLSRKLKQQCFMLEATPRCKKT